MKIFLSFVSFFVIIWLDWIASRYLSGRRLVAWRVTEVGYFLGGVAFLAANLGWRIDYASKLAFLGGIVAVVGVVLLIRLIRIHGDESE